MAWETRGNREYYYTKRREGQRVISEYVGTGELAEATATILALDRERKELEQAMWREERDVQRDLDREIDAVGDIARALNRAALLASGHHTHKGQWRRRRCLATK
jgi:hypothetical protein